MTREDSEDEEPLEADDHIGTPNVIRMGGAPRIQAVPMMGGFGGGGIADLLKEIGADDDSGQQEDGDYVEEKTTKDGRHIHKEVHKKGNVKTVRMTVEGGMPPFGMMGMDPADSLIGAIMGDMMA